MSHASLEEPGIQTTQMPALRLAENMPEVPTGKKNVKEILIDRTKVCLKEKRKELEAISSND